MTNLEEMLEDCTKKQLQDLRVLTGGWCSGGFGLYAAIRDYNGKIRNPNAVVLKAECGQEMTVSLESIDESQTISEVTVRGVKYVPA